MIGVSRTKKAAGLAEQALATALQAVTRNLVAYSETGDVFSASTEKDRSIKLAMDALARSQSEVASQISSKLDEMHSPPVLDQFPMDYTRFNFASYRGMLPRVMDDLSSRHASLATMRNELIEQIRKLSDAAALVTAAKIMTEKTVEKLNASCAGICPPVALAKDPAEIKPLVPVVKVIEVVETAPGVVVAAPAPKADDHGHGHDAHGHGGHDDHGHGGGHGGHDDHGHGGGHDDHGHGATATAEAPKAEAASAPAAAPAAAPEPAKAEAAPEPAAAKPAVDEDANFVATWKLESVGQLDGGKSNFLLASESADAGQLSKLARDTFHLVRHNVAMNPNTPKEILEGLKGDENVHVRRAAKKRLS